MNDFIPSIAPWILIILLFLVVTYLIWRILVWKVRNAFRILLLASVLSGASGGANLILNPSIIPFDIKGAILNLFSSGFSPNAAPSTGAERNTRLGKPIAAKDIDGIFLENPYFSLLYSPKLGRARWVAWHISPSDLGETDRQNDFREDLRLPSNHRLTATDYRGSGYSRGHICPSADRTNSVEANSSTFVMSNMAPQRADLNEGPWEKLERFTRSLSRRNPNVYVYAGTWGDQGRVPRSSLPLYAPTYFWKIVVVTGSSPSDIRRVISVAMPNLSGLKEANWREYEVPISKIELNTQLSFPKGIQGSENKYREN